MPYSLSIRSRSTYLVVERRYDSLYYRSILISTDLSGGTPRSDTLTTESYTLVRIVECFRSLFYIALSSSL